MKLSIETRCDMSETLDVRPTYTDVVYLYQDGSPGADAVGDAWLDNISEEK